VRGGLLILLFLSVVLPSQAQQWDWVRRWTNGTGVATSVALDAAGSIYVAGEFEGTHQLGTNALVSAGGSDVFVAKLNAAGDLQWVFRTGGANDDRATRLLVASNSTIYLCGQFTVTPGLLAPGADTNGGLESVFLARINNDGRFAWLRSGSNISNGRLALGPDETPWLLANSNQVFVHHYSASGALLHGTRVGESIFSPRGIAVDAQERVYITGFFVKNVDLGEIFLSHTGYSSYTVFTAGLNSSGLARWAWAVPEDYAESAGLAVAPDGNIVSIGEWGTILPQDYGFVVKHSPEGELLWRHDHTEDFKGMFRAYALVIDRRGIVHVAGQAIARFRSGSVFRQQALWLFDLSSDGRKLTQSFVITYGENSPAFATAIALNAEGDTFLSGAVGGRPFFGTNTFGDGPLQSPQPFVARRPTITPELRLVHTPAQVSLRWPHTALPFVLQASTTLESNSWTDVAFPQTNGPKQIVLPATPPLNFYRLRSTNEVPINHPPYIFYVKVESDFLGRTNVAITVSNSAAAIPFVAAVRDEDETDLFFHWWNHETGGDLTSGTSSQRINFTDGTSFWVARWNDPQTSWPLGTHSLRFAATDGAISVTNVLAFEVITAHHAISELIAAVQGATTEPETSNLVAPLQLADTALNTADYGAASSHLEEFKGRVHNSPQLTIEQKSLLEYSTDVLKAAFPPNG
jgi:hypothetical protein